MGRVEQFRAAPIRVGGVSNLAERIPWLSWKYAKSHFRKLDWRCDASRSAIYTATFARASRRTTDRMVR